MANRTLVTRALRIPADAVIARLLGAAWLQWGTRIGSQVAGDWALAAWDEGCRELCLVRAPNASQSIYFAGGQDGILFASVAQSLSRSGLIPNRPDWPSLATFMRYGDVTGDRTAFADVRRLRAGHAQRCQRGRWSEVPIWSPPAQAHVEPRDWVRDFRQIAEEVVADVLPVAGPIASQLSAGRDSSAVTAIAARVAPGRVHAITFVPRPGSVGKDTDRLIFDEGRRAQATARALGIAHVQVNGGSPEDQLAWLRKVQAWQFLPLLSAAGPGVRMAMAAAAARLDARVMLTGAFGNLGLSAGGTKFLADLRSEGGLAAWWPVARSLARREGWRTVAHHSAPVPLRILLRKFRDGRSMPQHPYWCGPLAAALSQRAILSQGIASGRQEVGQVIDQMDMADPQPWIFHGVTPLDPTADHRLVEFVLRAPASFLLDGTGGRPLFEAAFADFLPRDLLQERRRGRQVADWWTAFDPAVLEITFTDLSRHPFVEQAIDLNAATRPLAYWPRSFEEAFRCEDAFSELLGTLSLAMFLAENF